MTRVRGRDGGSLVESERTLVEVMNETGRMGGSQSRLMSVAPKTPPHQMQVRGCSTHLYSLSIADNATEAEDGQHCMPIHSHKHIFGFQVQNNYAVTVKLLETIQDVSGQLERLGEGQLPTYSSKGSRDEGMP